MRDGRPECVLRSIEGAPAGPGGGDPRLLLGLCPEGTLRPPLDILLGHFGRTPRR